MNRKHNVLFYCTESTKHKLLNGSSTTEELTKYQLHGPNKWELKCLKGTISPLQKLKTEAWGILVATNFSVLYNIIVLSGTQQDCSRVFNNKSNIVLAIISTAVVITSSGLGQAEGQHLAKCPVIIFLPPLGLCGKISAESWRKFYIALPSFLFTVPGHGTK